MSSGAHRFEFNDGNSSKFWEIEVAGTQFTVRYGKIGTTGQTQVKEFADAAAAAKAGEKLIAEKTSKGYLEVGAPPETVASTDASSVLIDEPDESNPKPLKGVKPKKSHTLEVFGKASQASTQSNSKPISGTRYFELCDSSSIKFWEIKIDLLRSMYRIRHGVTGTPGKKTIKEFEDSEAMFMDATRLIDESLARGFVEKTMLDQAIASFPIAYGSIALYEEARRLIRSVQRDIERKSDYGEIDADKQFHLPSYMANALRGAVAWKFSIDEIQLDQVDRTKSMFKGPFFITDEYPVPKTKSGEYMVPVVQADLRELTRLRGIPLGDGLLQAWMGMAELGEMDDWECRVIPRHVVANQTPLPFPMDIEAFDSTFRDSMADWMPYEFHSGEPDEEALRVVPVISGYCDPQVHIDVEINDDVEDLENPDIARIVEILRTLKAGCQFCDQAFGSFHGFHGRHQEPRHVDAECLFAFGEEENFSFGGEGKAHVMYEFKGGSPHFYFTWEIYGAR